MIITHVRVEGNRGDAGRITRSSFCGQTDRTQFRIPESALRIRAAKALNFAGIRVVPHSSHHRARRTPSQ
jgi:hypothetical protein